MALITQTIMKHFLLSGLMALACSLSCQAQNLTIEDVLKSAASDSTFAQTQIDHPRGYLLVSLSMPEASLNRLAVDAKDAGIPLVFRGVPKVKEEKDAKALPLLNPQSLMVFQPFIEQGVSVEINPELFKDHGLKEVPALILKPAKSQPNSEDALVIKGDVTLGFMLDEAIKREEQFMESARHFRQKLGARP